MTGATVPRGATALAMFAIMAETACSSARSGSGANENAEASVPTLNGCTPEMFVNGSSATIVSFGGISGSPLFGYAPSCVRISTGESVSFRGDFSVHPISPGTTPTTTTAGSANNPIRQTDTGNALSVTFPTAGTYPYFCQMHYAAGMSGVVLVE